MKKLLYIFLALILLFLIFTTITTGQDVELIFSHKLHTEEVEAECSACHAAADTSTQAAENLLPDMETCYQCHDEDAECSMCHKDPDNAIAYPRIIDYIDFFPHEKHLANNIECITCHTGVEKSEDIFAKHLPSMQNCVSCHKDIEAVDYCYACHSKQKDLEPIDHKTNWVAVHGLNSYTDEENCKMCHTETQCLDCHQGDNLDRQVHPLNFVNNHAIEAKSNNDKCYTCHEEEAFCQDCHREQFVLPRNHSFVGWSNKTTGGKHKMAAQMDLDNCLSCHSDAEGDPVCADCHTK